MQPAICEELAAQLLRALLGERVGAARVGSGRCKERLSGLHLAGTLEGGDSLQHLPQLAPFAHAGRLPRRRRRRLGCCCRPAAVGMSVATDGGCCCSSGCAAAVTRLASSAATSRSRSERWRFIISSVRLAGEKRSSTVDPSARAIMQPAERPDVKAETLLIMLICTAGGTAAAVGAAFVKLSSVELSSRSNVPPACETAS
mmetsp:Transcript_22850/g.73117  ORF Transcript_22850/g.73117 Transcript_22850/m.73117 type:complete len:201 (+) Transcript_22850:1030-1632(+)